MQKGEDHAVSIAGSVRRPVLHFVRAGTNLYGVHPNSRVGNKMLKLVPTPSSLSTAIVPL